MATDNTHPTDRPDDPDDHPTVEGDDAAHPNLPVGHTPPAGHCQRCGEPLTMSECRNCEQRDDMGW